MAPRRNGLGPMPQMVQPLADVVLATHLVLIAFNVAGLVLIPIGGWLGWSWVKIRWWRVLHLVSLAVVAVQAALGRDCFLTIWQSVLSGRAPQPLITRWVNALIYWPLPPWVFTAAYIAAFVYTAALWWWVRPAARRPARASAPPP